MMIPITLYDSIKIAGLVRSGVAKLSEIHWMVGCEVERSERSGRRLSASDAEDRSLPSQTLD